MERKNRQFKMISLFSGSGGFEFAASLCGIEPVAASEVEPYPIKVTKARFPNMKHYGDISKIHGAELEPVDVVTGGSPCQSLSVAGKRDGMSKKCLECGHLVLATEESEICPKCGGVMAYTRSGLFMEQIRIIKEMREADEARQLRMRGTTEHIRPRFMLWENVTGAFSSNKGEDFRAVLEETARICEKTAIIPRPPKGKWHNEGIIVGDGYSIAWRVLDAQFWGVPQRRRRIALVADFGGQCAGEILFKRDGLQRNFTESGKPWKTITGSASQGVGEARKCIVVENHPNDSRVNINDSGICQTLTRRMGTGGGNVPLTMQVRCGDEKGGGKGALLQVNLSATLDTKNMQTLFQPVPIQDQAISNGNGNGLGIGKQGDPMYSLMAETNHGICVIEGNGARPSHRGDGFKESDIMYTLNATEQHAVAYGMGGFADYVENRVGTLKASGSDLGGGSETLVVENKTIFRMEAFGQYSESDKASCMKSRDHKDATDLIVEPYYIVRRLTPLECCRLQGFPDGWTDGIEIPDPTEKDLQFWREVFETHRKVVTGAKKPKTDAQIIKWLKEPDKDGAKYKLWGNGIALPCFLYVMEGIKEVLERTSNE